MKVAALDLGSNTFLCLIAEVEKAGVTRVYSDHAEVVRLGQDLEKTGRFHAEALARAELCFQKFADVIAAERPEEILAMATSASRDAANQDELFALGKKYGIPIEIIPGEKEAQITYQGAVSGLKAREQNILVVDIGGGSTEFIFGRDSELLAGESYNIGCVRLTEKFFTRQPTPTSETAAAEEFLRPHLAQMARLLPPGFSVDCILAVAGTPTSLAAAEIGRYDAGLIDGYILTETKLQNWFEKLKNATLDEKIKMGVPAGRADVILIGVMTLLQTLRMLGLHEIQVSTRGVRYGVALEMGHRFLSDI